MSPSEQFSGGVRFIWVFRWGARMNKRFAVVLAHLVRRREVRDHGRDREGGGHDRLRILYCHRGFGGTLKGRMIADAT